MHLQNHTVNIAGWKSNISCHHSMWGGTKNKQRNNNISRIHPKEQQSTKVIENAIYIKKKQSKKKHCKTLTK